MRCGEILGADYAFANFPEVATEAYPLTEMVAVIDDYIQRTDPAVLYVPHPGDVNQDHRRVFEAAAISTRQWQPPCHVRRVLAYFSDAALLPGSILAANVGHRLTVGQVTIKMRAFEAYASEHRPSPHPRSGVKIIDAMTACGARWHAEYAEEFSLIWEAS